MVNFKSWITANTSNCWKVNALILPLIAKDWSTSWYVTKVDPDMGRLKLQTYGLHLWESLVENWFHNKYHIISTISHNSIILSTINHWSSLHQLIISPGPLPILDPLQKTKFFAGEHRYSHWYQTTKGLKYPCKIDLRLWHWLHSTRWTPLSYVCWFRFTVDEMGHQLFGQPTIRHLEYRYILYPISGSSDLKNRLYMI